ncbi:hypothetical protein VPH35_055792 [Triticum aestivum]
MKGLADELAAAGKKMDEDDLVSQILQGLDADYNPFVSAISAKTNEQVITLADLYSGLLVAETRLEAQNPVHQQQFSVNLAAKGGRGGSSSNNRGNSSGNSRGGRPDDGRGNYHTNNQRQGNSGGGYGGGYGGGGYNSNNSDYGGHNSGYGGGGYNGGSYGGGATTTIPVLMLSSVRFVPRPAMMHIAAGSGLRRTTRGRRRPQTPRPPLTESTPIGTSTPGRLTISRVS